MRTMVWFNPFEHLTASRALTDKEWKNIKSRLSSADLYNIENGGYAKLGAAKVWDAQRREARRQASAS